VAALASLTPSHHRLRISAAAERARNRWRRITGPSVTGGCSGPTTNPTPVANRRSCKQRRITGAGGDGERHRTLYQQAISARPRFTPSPRLGRETVFEWLARSCLTTIQIGHRGLAETLHACAILIDRGENRRWCSPGGFHRVLELVINAQRRSGGAIWPQQRGRAHSLATELTEELRQIIGRESECSTPSHLILQCRDACRWRQSHPAHTAASASGSRGADDVTRYVAAGGRRSAVIGHWRGDRRRWS